MSAAPPPAASIVITAYNAEHFIGASVRAALSQTCESIEVVVLDDGSSDRTGDICRAIDDPRLRYLRRPRIGRCRALNEAVTAARGTYIAINDADDLSFPHRVQYTLDFLRSHPEVAFAGTGFVVTEVFRDSITHAGTSLHSDHGPATTVWPSKQAVYRQNLFINSTLMYPKSIWQRIGGYDEGLTNSEDYDFQLRAMQFGQAALLPEKTVLWYTNPHGFFKQKSKREHQRTIGSIKRRAHRLLGLPLWLKLYHPAWLVAQRYPRIAEAINRVGSWSRRPVQNTAKARSP